MEKQFIPYELALELKELGFDEKCFGCYNMDNKLWCENPVNGIDYIPEDNILAPLWQQAFDWFREKHELLNHPTTHLNPFGEDGALEESYGYRIMINKDGWKCSVWEKLSEYESYEEARLECLKKLIEIVKQQ